VSDEAAYVAVVTEARNGVIVPGAVNGYPVQMLVDTGAAVSLISDTLADILCLEEIREKVPKGTALSLCSVDGTKLRMMGKVPVCLSVQDTPCLHEVHVVRNLHYTCIVGRDVLSQIPCAIVSDGQQLRFSVGETARKDKCSIRLKDRLVLPPHHEIVVSGVYEEGCEPASVCITEQSACSRENGIVFARAVVRPENGCVPVRLLNCTEEIVTLPRRAIVGELEPVGDSIVVEDVFTTREDARSSAEVISAAVHVHDDTTGVIPEKSRNSMEECEDANEWCQFSKDQSLWEVLRVGSCDPGKSASLGGDTDMGPRSHCPGGQQESHPVDEDVDGRCRRVGTGPVGRQFEHCDTDVDGRSHNGCVAGDKHSRCDTDTAGRCSHIGTGAEMQYSPQCGERPEDTGAAVRNTGDEPTSEELAQLRQLVERYRDVFAMSGSELGKTHVLEHSIKTKCDAPVCQPARRLPWHSRQKARELVNEMIEQGIVEESSSPWSSPIVMVRKKDGSTRFCVDYRKLNAVTVTDPYPLPRIDDTLDALGGAQYFSTLDLCSGYHQLPVAAGDKEKTAFSTPDGHYEFNVMPFGVCNGPSSFQRLMSAVLRGLQWQICLVYLDDIIVFSATFEEHVARLEMVFQRLRDAGLRLKPSKCHLLCSEVEFLGHIVSREGVRTDPAKTSKVADWPRPTSVGEVRSFLGFCSYYRRFVANFASIAKPLTGLTRAGQRFQWTESCEQAFLALKERLANTPVLAYPRFEDDMPPFILDVDASGVGLGAVLSQADETGLERPVAFASRVISPAETRYGSKGLSGRSSSFGASCLAASLWCELIIRHSCILTSSRNHRLL